jgi:hypothetical protein
MLYTGEKMAKKSLERQDSGEAGRPMYQAIAKLNREGAISLYAGRVDQKEVYDQIIGEIRSAPET